MGLFSTTVTVEYLGGHPDLSKKTKVTISKEGTELVLSAGWLKKVRIPLSSVRSLHLGVGHKRSAGKAVAGAVIAGALTGGIGALVGAAIGGRRKEDNTATLIVERNGVELGITLADCNGDKYAMLAKLVGG